MEKSDSKIGKIIGGIVIAVIVILLIFSAFGTVSAGEMGIKSRLGKVVTTISPGLYFKVPFIDSVDVWDIQTQKEQADAAAASSDLQIVDATVAVNYSIDQNKLTDIYSRIGDSYKIKLIDPAIQEVVKAVTANYTAEQLITARQEVTDKIQAQLKSRLSPSDIDVSAVSIVNFNFSKSFNDAIEAKVTAEQNALAAKNKLDQIKYEADQTVTTATAEAEAIKIKTQAINSQGGASYVQLQAINQWDGHLPAQMIPGSSLPFININK